MWPTLLANLDASLHREGVSPREVRAALGSVVPEPGLLREDRRRGDRYWFPICLLEDEDWQTMVRDMVAQFDQIAEALEPMAKVGAPDGALDSVGDPFEVGEDSGVAGEMEDSDVRDGNRSGSQGLIRGLGGGEEKLGMALWTGTETTQAASEVVAGSAVSAIRFTARLSFGKI